MLEVAFAHSFDGFALDVAFEAGAGVTALVGPSGAGKSTVIAAVAGLLAPRRGRIVMDGTVWLDTDRRINRPAHARRIGLVFQEGRLFPHMDVRANLAYGRRRRGLGAFRDGDPLIAMLGIGHLLDRRPATLSGGEKQRVAIGRALLSEPRLLLMDEPLASLDTARKDEILPYLERLKAEAAVPILYVSHAAAEVERLADRVVRLRDGAVDPAPDGTDPQAGTVTSVDGTVMGVRFGDTTVRLPALPGIAIGDRVRLTR